MKYIFTTDDGRGYGPYPKDELFIFVDTVAELEALDALDIGDKLRVEGWEPGTWERIA